MTELKSMNEKLELLRESVKDPDTRVFGSGLWIICHNLADAGCLPAKAIFIDMLDDPRWDWRRTCVSLLGFHYKLEQKTLNKIRELLLNDPDSGVRIVSAYTLGNQAKLPEKTLISAMENDQNELVREAAFSALLNLANVPYKTRRKKIKQNRDRDVPPSLTQIKSILKEENKLSELELFELL
jgi:HEAT repeat protein